MTFVPADALSLSAFLLVVTLVVVSVLVGTWVAASRDTKRPDIAWRHTARALAALVAWIAVTGLWVSSGILVQRPMPLVPLTMAAVLIAAVGAGLSPAGDRLARQLPVTSLVAFQGFRLPLELVLHAWADHGTVPATMTWTGANVDIVSAIVALLAAPVASRWRWAAWTANIVGIVLLINVGRVAVLSSPLPFAWHVDPPLQLIFHMPYALIATVCVAGAAAGHVVLTRRLLRG